MNEDLAEHARTDEAASRLTSIPGIGILGATALVAAVGDGEAFRRARDIPAWLGLVPKQMTTGGNPRLLGITKRGNTYLRMLLIHGARAALPSLSKQAAPLGLWLRGLLSRAHRSVVIVALPVIFAGVKAALTFAVIGAIVGEFVGASEGLGYLVDLYNHQLRIDRVFAVITILAAIGAGGYFLLEWLDEKLIFWRNEEGR